jgi:hypothetical protein
VIGNGRGFSKVYPMERKNESIYTLDDFGKKVEIPETLLCNNNTTMEGWREWKKRIRKCSIDPKYTEPHSPFQNKAELYIRELKRLSGGCRIRQDLHPNFGIICDLVRKD